MTEQLFTFQRYDRSTNRNERDEMIKQAVTQAQAINAKRIFVSQQWLDQVKPALTALCFPKKLHWNDHINVECLGVSFIVDTKLTDPFSFKLELPTT